jgi:hypothetical protein
MDTKETIIMREDVCERRIRQGVAAWGRLRRDNNWHDWMCLGEALQIGRDWAMNQAGTNKPVGKGYNLVMGEWLKKHKLDTLDKGERSRLLDCIDNRASIEEWRKTLTLTARLKYNHPTAVLRRWQAFIEPEPRADDGSVEPKPTLRDSVRNLSEDVDGKAREIDALKAHIEELEARAAACPHCSQAASQVESEPASQADADTLDAA